MTTSACALAGLVVPVYKNERLATYSLYDILDGKQTVNNGKLVVGDVI